MMAHASPFKASGMCVQGSSIASKAKTWNCIMTAAISRSFTSLSRERMWAKPTAQPLWDNGSVSGKPQPSAVLTGKRRGRPQPLRRRSGFACRKRSRKPKSSADGLRKSVKRRGSLIASARRFILLMCSPRLLPCRNLRRKPCGCRKQRLTQMGNIPSMFYPSVHMRRRRTYETSGVASRRMASSKPPSSIGFRGSCVTAWKLRRWHVIVAEPGSGKTMGIRDLSSAASREAGMIGGRRYPVLAVTAPKNDPKEAALGNFLLTALGLGARGHWSERKYLLFELLIQYGVECLVIDDAHDLSMPHLIFFKELTDQLQLSFSQALGLCLVAAGRGPLSPSKMSLISQRRCGFNFDDDWITFTPIAELLAIQRQKCAIFCWPWSAFIAHPFLN